MDRGPLVDVKGVRQNAFDVARMMPTTSEENDRRLAALLAIQNAYDKLNHAGAVLAEFPSELSWMSKWERLAYALETITDVDIVECPRCHGRGWIPKSPDNQVCGRCRQEGRVISDEGRAMIKAAFPDYEIR